MITLAQMVRDECANWRRMRTTKGEIAGCIFHRSGDCPVCRGERCNISKSVLLGGKADDGGPDYFGAAVAPMAPSFPRYADAAAHYAMICGKGIVDIRKCECGEPLAKRRRLCEKCLRKRQAEGQRQWRQKHKSA